MCWSRGFKRGKTGPGSEGEQVFITRAGGGGECAREREKLVQRLVTGRRECQGKGKTGKRTSPPRGIWEGWGTVDPPGVCTKDLVQDLVFILGKS